MQKIVLEGRSTAIKNLCNRFVRELPPSPEYLLRLIEELDIVEHKGFVRCFEQVSDIIEYTRSRGIPHVLRGSGACSLLCYMLGITSIDPVKEGMVLARFMNKNRSDQPDIDIDVPHWIRPQILEHIYQKWPGQVARISNDVKYREKTALRKILKEFGVKGHIPKYFDVSDYFDDAEEVEEIKRQARELVGEHRHWSLHCGGIIIYDDSVPEDLILKENQIRLTKYDVDEQNLIKIDLLCNRGLSQLWDLSDMPLSEYPYEDEAIAEMLSSGEVLGLTQAESRTMRKAFLALKPKNYHDVALALALIRPAAADGGRKAAYFKSMNAQTRKRMIIYDDDALGFIAEKIDCSLEEADKYRRAFKKGKEKLIGEFYERLGSNSTKELQVRQLNELNKYSFCKGHSLAYGQLVWALAYHKKYNPKRFWEATLKHVHSSYRPWVHKHEAQRAGVFVPNRYHVLKPLDQFKEQGWWAGSEFLPNCFVTRHGETEYVLFRGLVANMRKLWRYGSVLRFMTIGIGDGKYVDLTISKEVWDGNYTIVQGAGIVKKNDNAYHIEVLKMWPTWITDLESKKYKPLCVPHSGWQSYKKKPRKPNRLKLF